jgi:alkanesulfonate monooxygenase
MAPTSGDGPYPGSGDAPAGNWTAAGEREPDLEYLARVARAAADGGFSTLLLPVGTGCLDGWTIAAFLAARTPGLRFLVALRPGFVQPAVAARQASTFDYLSGGRTSINVVTGGSPPELARDGDFLDHDARYRRTAEFIPLVKRLLEGERVDHAGEFFRLEGASLYPRPVQRPRPPFFIAGESPAGTAVVAREAEVYMTWGGPLPELARRRREVAERFAAAGRRGRYSVSFQVILGDTEAEAWDRAEAMRERMSAAAVARQRDHFRTMDSAGQRRLAGYVEASAGRGFRLGPNLWAGLTQVLGGNSVALVGTPDQVADRLVEYHDAGYDHVLLRGFPHLEAITALGREVLPRVRTRLADREGEAVPRRRRTGAPASPQNAASVGGPGDGPVTGR